MAEEENVYHIDKDRFWKRLSLLHQAWTAHLNANNSSALTIPGWENCDCILICCGKNDEQYYKKNNTIHLWLFGFQLLSTILVITPNIVYICAGEKTYATLQQLGTSNGDLKVEYIVKDKSDKYQSNYSKLTNIIKSSNNGISIGYIEEPQEGKFIKQFLEIIKSDNNLKIVNYNKGLSDILMIKDKFEQTTMKTIGELTSHIMAYCVKKIEKVVERDETITHLKLSENLLQILENPKIVKSNLKKDNLDVCYDPIIQSGGKFKLKVSTESDELNLYYNGGCVVIMLGYRLRDYCCNIARTIYFDASDEQHKIYNLLLKCFKKGLLTLRNNVQLSKVYESCLKVIKKSKMQHLEKHFLKNVGWGIGLEFRDKNYTIDKKNTLQAKTGMVFNFQVGFNNLEDLSKKDKGEKASKYSVIIADTVVVTNDQIEWVTKYTRQIADYAISDPTQDKKESSPKTKEKSKLKPSTKEKEKTKEKRKDSKKKHNSNSNSSNNESSNSDNNESDSKDESMQAIQGRRYVTRGTNKKAQELNNLQREARRKREENQKKIRKIKHSNLLNLLEKTGGDLLNKTEEKEYIDPLCYNDTNNLPSHLDQSRVYVDPKNESLICPIMDHMVPFHISTIKNYSISQSNDWHYLRINFMSPVAQTNNRKIKQPDVAIAHPEAMFIKELTFRSIDNNLSKVAIDLKNLQKQIKLKQKQEKEQPLIKQDKLKRAQSSKLIVLKDVSVKPSLGGRKKNTGRLECHANGLRYLDHKKNEVHILFNNIKKSFYQPAKNTPAVIIHFNLKNAIIVGKKPSNDVQIYRDVIDRFEDIGRSNYDYDGIQAEREERRRIQRTNKQFKEYIKNVEKLSKENNTYIEFDIPEMDLVFEGVPGKQNVRMYPTGHCLISLEDNPPFVLCTSDIELAHFERVDFSLKNFDLVFVYKDYKKEPIRVATIPREHLDTLQDFLNWQNVMYSQGKSNLDWKEIIKMVTTDLTGFIDNGGWEFLREEEKALQAPSRSVIEARKRKKKNNNKKSKNKNSPSKSNSYDSDGEYYIAESGSEYEPDNNDQYSDQYSDDYSDSNGNDDENSYSEDEYSDEYSDGGDENEEGLDWDEMEKKAVEQDKKQRLRERNQQFRDGMSPGGRSGKRRRR